ncbi:hypothetical protein SAY87_013053 [Trapa incisa]|uniref:C2 domain-containing protein n=1 Tax=Trapa incisa TaxID=236973 RepID=A0AAN7KIV8_9MYRT|nr:hypothetical protein SAY87_013053 [Trapa incisa]
MEGTSLELTGLSCSGLKAFNFFKKLCPYLAVSVVSGPDHKPRVDGERDPSQRQVTTVDPVGNRNPEWRNHTVSFDLGPYIVSTTSSASGRVSWDTYVKFEVRRTCSIFGSQPIGEVWIRLRDLVEEFSGAQRHHKYQVKKGEEVVGTLSFWCSVNGKQLEMMGSARADDRRRRPGVTKATPSNPSPSPVPPHPQPHQMPAPYKDIFYVQNNGTSSSICRPIDPAPEPGHT